MATRDIAEARDPNIEALVLSACLLGEGQNLAIAKRLGLTEEDFSDARNRQIFGAMLAATKATPALTQEELNVALRDHGFSDFAHYTQVTGIPVTSARLQSHIDELRETTRKRRIHGLAKKLFEVSNDRGRSSEVDEILADLGHCGRQPVTDQSQAMDWDALLSFDPEKDSNALFGDRFLGRTDGAVICAPSGVGKSSLALQLAICATLGKPFFGVTIHQPLRVLFVQAEDSLGDVAEAAQGIREGYSLCEPHDNALRARLKIVRWNDCAGDRFLERLRQEYDRFPYDLVIINPLFSFLGGNVSDQEVMSAFLRNGLNPILTEKNAAGIIVHHTNKPAPPASGASDPKEDDMKYFGSGSAELTNWARAYVTLTRVARGGPGTYKLAFVKRGSRAGLVDPSGKPVSFAYIEHSPDGIFWRQSDCQERGAGAGKFVKKIDLKRAQNDYDPTKSWARNKETIAKAQGLTPRAVSNYRGELEAGPKGLKLPQ